MMVVLSACTLVNNPDQQVPASDFYKGTKAITMDFVKNAPPAEVYEDAQFAAVVRIRNQGPYHIGYQADIKEDQLNGEGELVIVPEPGYLGIEGFDLNSDNFAELGLYDSDTGNSIAGTEGRVSFKLKGRSMYDSVGEEDLLYINIKANKLESMSLSHPSIIYATACYPYRAKLSATVCVDSDIYNLRAVKKPCQNKALVFSSGQGGPLAITRVEMTMLPSVQGSPAEKSYKPELLISVENKGTGDLVKSYEYACDQKLSGTATGENNFNLVAVKASISGETQGIVFDCAGDYASSKPASEKGYARLNGKTSVIRCVVGQQSPVKEITEGTLAYTAPLLIQIDYGYMDTISKSFKIKKPN